MCRTRGSEGDNERESFSRLDLGRVGADRGLPGASGIDGMDGRQGRRTHFKFHIPDFKPETFDSQGAVSQAIGGPESGGPGIDTILETASRQQLGI